METKSNAPKYMGLREIARRLSIPPSTVVYYRDRFSKYIPQKLSPGGRCKYPPECLAIFETIRWCFSQKWSWEQVDEALRAQYPVVSVHNRGPGQIGPDDSISISQNQFLLQEMTASMGKIANALDQQTALLGQLNHLQDELKNLRDEKQRSEDQYRRQIGRLENELNRLKDGCRQEARQQACRERQRQDRPGPDDDFMSNPLTVHYPPKRYLGIKDSRNAALNLDQLIRTIKKNAPGAKSAYFSWHKSVDTWTLTANLQNPDTGKERKLILVAKATITPQGNPVTEIVRMNIEGQELSKDDLLKFFKLYKAGMDPGKPC